MGNITIQGDLTGDVPGGEVGGASNLTTVGAIPYVSAPGVLNQTANLSFDVANNRLVLGSATVQRFSTDLSLSRASAGVLQVGDGGSNANGQVVAAKVGVASSPLGLYALTVDQTGYWLAAIGAAVIRNDLAEWAITSSIRDITIGREFGVGPLRIQARTDPYTVNIGKYSNRTTGTVNIEDATPTTGVTRAVIRAGAGQSTTNLTEWQNSGGGVITYIANSGDIVSTASIQSPSFLGVDNSATYIALRGAGGASAVAGLSRGQSQFAVFSDYKIGFLSGTNVNATTTSADTALSRNAAGVIEINNGTAGTYRDLILRRSQHNGVTVADLPAAAAGNAGSIQYVTDANATTIGSTVAGGGANKVMVWSDGAAWKIFAS